MNWEEIKEKYPLAYTACIYWADSNIDLDEETDEPVNIRDLYEFFDNRDVIIEILPSYDQDVNFSWEIRVPGDLQPVTVDSFISLTRSRKESEIEAFEAAFKFLENRMDEYQKEYGSIEV
jgi:hypothetical protein